MDQIVRSLVAQNAMLNARLSALESIIITGGLPGGGGGGSPTPDGGGIVVDPAPDEGWGRFNPGVLVSDVLERFRGRIPVPPEPVDPSPVELGKLSRVQLELRVSEIELARKKLDALEGLLNDAIRQQG